MEYITIDLENGFSADIENERLDDYELFEDLVEIDENPAIMPRVFKKILGEDGYKELKECCRGADGRVKTSEMFASMREVFQQIQNSKKN